jgi:ABC-type sugar transport system substrate-binding protein
MDSAMYVESKQGRIREGGCVVQHHTKRQLCGAAVVGGMAGLVTLGPIGGVLIAGGAAFAATRKGKVGAVMRSTGDTMADIGKSLKEFDRNHGISDKTVDGIIEGNRWVSKQLQSSNKTNFGHRPQ